MIEGLVAFEAYPSSSAAAATLLLCSSADAEMPLIEPNSPVPWSFSGSSEDANRAAILNLGYLCIGKPHHNQSVWWQDRTAGGGNYSSLRQRIPRQGIGIRSNSS